ncbi:hypothetical protein R3P38DRAFT_2593844 [Favolaschia claudopus]|uniref:F-box domain-containing protein n=1 Tax=Favolaschia claudopus TaxID=2862362 RepID=A0AAW0EEE8_9AGAR
MFLSLYELFFPQRADATSTSTSATVQSRRSPRLPLELALNIIEQACYDLQSLDAERAHLLSQCALVCRDWSVSAQKLLFTSVSLATQASCDAFLTAVDRATPRGCMLGDAVVCMKVVLDHNQPLGLSQQSFAHAVIACPKLSELGLALYGCASPGNDEVGLPDVLRMQRPAPSFDETTLELLRQSSPIVALDFSNWSENYLSVTQLLDIWPSLKSLRISGTPPNLPSTSLEPFPCSLGELRMNFQTSPSVDFMKWLLHNSTRSLRVLELEREASFELLDYLAEAHGETLRSLTLPACTSYEHAQAVQKCAQLGKLRMDNPFVVPSLYKRLPAGLEHVALTLDHSTVLQPVVDAVRTAESLKAVTLHLWESGDLNPQLPVLKLACAYRGVELKMTKDIRLFRSLARHSKGLAATVMSSLSSVVSTLVRAQMGSSVPPQVTDDELDKAVAELILKEAKKKAERFGQDGIRAYLRSGLSDSNAPRTNKRFLSSIIRSTDDHNKTILQAQAQAAQELKRERDEIERRERRARAEEAVTAEKLRRSRGEGSSSWRKTKDKAKAKETDSWDHWDGRTAERPKRKQRDWETWNGETSDEEDERDRRRRRSRSRDGRRRDDDRHSSSKRRKSERSTQDESRRHRKDDKRSSRSHKKPQPHSDDEPESADGRGRPARSNSKPRRYALDSLSPARSSTGTEDSPSRKRKHSSSPSPSRSESHRSRHASPALSKPNKLSSREVELRQKLKSTRTNDDSRPPEPSSTPPPPPPLPPPPPSRKSKREGSRDSSCDRTNAALERTNAALDRAKAAARLIHPPSRSPTPGPEPEVQLPSKMDKYFEESYDPRLDVAPLAIPKVPATGLINNADFEGWDAMLELIRVRREDKEEKKMMERLGITKEKTSKSSGIVKGPISSSAANDRWSGEGLNIMHIEYNKRGAVREWDMGKEGF